MTTGYTEDLEDGKITDFAEFAKHCARAFFIWSRDNEEPLPEKFTPNHYYVCRLAGLQSKLTTLMQMSEVEKRRGANFVVLKHAPLNHAFPGNLRIPIYVLLDKELPKPSTRSVE